MADGDNVTYFLSFQDDTQRQWQAFFLNGGQRPWNLFFPRWRTEKHVFFLFKMAHRDNDMRFFKMGDRDLEICFFSRWRTETMTLVSFQDGGLRPWNLFSFSKMAIGDKDTSVLNLGTKIMKLSFFPKMADRDEDTCFAHIGGLRPWNLIFFPR
jgi:hypothetical protein